MNQGYIKLHRQLQDCWIWKKGPFSEGQAWVDLLLLANHKDVKMVIGGELTTVSRGSYHTSIVSLSERWKWSRPRVKRFLTLLERDNMLTQKCTPYGTTLTVVNYGVFQDVVTTSVTTNVHQSFSERAPNVTQTINVKNDKNDKNVKNDKKVKKEKKIYGEYGHVRLSDDECEKLRTEYGEVITDEAVIFLDEYIEMKGYKAKSHYLAIRKWVVSAVKEQKARNKKNGGNELLDMINGGVFDDFPL